MVSVLLLLRGLGRIALHLVNFILFLVLRGELCVRLDVNTYKRRELYVALFRCPFAEVILGSVARRNLAIDREGGFP